MDEPNDTAPGAGATRGDGGGGPAILRYWPVLVVVLVIAAVVAIAALGGDDEDDDDVASGPDTTEEVDGGDDQVDEPVDAGTDDLGDASDAPDCDPDTGRIMVPSLFAPNCVPLWPEGGDNGGATHTGVTADEIVVVVYDSELSEAGQQAQQQTGITTPEEAEEADNRLKMVGAFNDLYETYGRTVRVEVHVPTGDGNDEAAARADAITIAEELGAFAVINGPGGGAINAYVNELVDREVMCFCTASQPIENYLEWAPHVWSGLMASTQGYVHRADFVANRLAGSPAQHAGDPEYQEQERTFGLVWYETPDGAYQRGVEFFEQELAANGLELDASIRYIAGGNTEEDAQAIITQLKAEGITTVILATDPLMPQNLTRQATSQDYWPEWLVVGATLTDSSDLARLYDQDQWANAFGLSYLLAPIHPDYTQQEGNLVSWHLGEELSNYPDLFDWQRFFTGVHLAGPELTPETFRDGMFSYLPVSGHLTQFGTSYGEGLWEWPDYLAADDVTLIWWDPDEPDPRTDAGNVGMYRYVDGGARYLPGELGDATGEFFDPDGTIVVYDERPEGDRPPRYPRRSGREG